MKDLRYVLMGVLVGCAAARPKEPYVWRDDDLPVGVHRADVARAEAVVLEFLESSGFFETIPHNDCLSSGRAWEVSTAETDLAFEVSLLMRTGLCSQAPEATTLPPMSLYQERPIMFAVRKSDFHLIRERLWGDEASPMSHPGVITLAESALKAVAGSCSGPVRIQLRPSPRYPTVANVKDPVTIALSADPPSVIFFSDPACTTATNRLTLDRSTGTEIYFRAIQGGQVKIVASPDQAQHALITPGKQTHAVDPAPPVTVAFTTAPQTIAPNGCSDAITVQARDAFGNPATVSAPTQVQLAAEPAEGASFYADPGCAGRATTAIEIPRESNVARFYVKGRSARPVSIAAGLNAGSASQAVLVSPKPSPPP